MKQRAANSTQTEKQQQNAIMQSTPDAMEPREGL